MPQKSASVLGRMIMACAALLALILLAAPPVTSAPAGNNETKTIPSIASNPTGFDRTLRGAFETLMSTMLKFERGIHGDVGLGLLYSVLEIPPSVKADFRDSYLINAAKRLYVILQNVDYDPIEDIPLNIPGDTTNIVLGREDGLKVTFHMKKLPGGGWAFAAETLDDSALKKLYDQLRVKHEKLSRSDLEGDTFQLDLMSPYRTVRTLFHGVTSQSGYTLEDAIQTLELSETDSVIRKQFGKIIAVELYRILKFRSPLDISELSADPNYKKLPILLVNPQYGVITMAVVKDPKTGIKAWKFTAKSLEVVLDSYDDYMADGMAAHLGRDNGILVGGELPLHIRVDDFFQVHMPRLEKTLFGVNLWKWLFLLALLGLTPLVLWTIRHLIKGLCRMSRVFDREDLAYTPRSLVLPMQIAVTSFLWLQGVLVITVDPYLLQVTFLVLDGIIMATMVWISWIVVESISRGIMGADRANVRSTVIQVISRILKIGLVVGGMIYFAALFGQDSTRILTALGIGGVALALAGKDTVENIFGTFMILSTRPFAIGDWIVVKGIEGTVENVGIRSTAIRTFYNSLVNVPNSTFILIPVDNMGKRTYRRYKGIISITYDTPPNLIVAFLEGIRELVHSHPLTRKDYFHIRLNEFSPSSLDILVYIFFKTKDWTVELTERERFILDVVRLAETLGVQFAFPTQTINLVPGQAPEYVVPSAGESSSEGRDAALTVIQADPNPDHKS